MPRPLFLTGLARGGTNLLARMLIAGGASRIAIHAFLPWFRSLRNAVVARHGAPEITAAFDPDSPFGDGYFDDVQLAVQTLLHSATLEVPFAAKQWPALMQQLDRRAADEAADLRAGLTDLAGAPDYRAMMDRILSLILRGHERGADYVGLIDTWIIDLLPALARAYTEARFLIVIRDPRGIVASQLKFAEENPASAGHVLSIIRQWRKYVALSYEFLHDPLFSGRLKLVRYEDQVDDPERFAKGLCDFLDLPFRPAMTDFASYKDAASKAKWRGNSAFDVGLQTIDPAVGERWRQNLAPDAVAAIEFCCSFDMTACGYVPVRTDDTLAADPGPLAFLIADGKRPSSWRTDTGDAQAEFARESTRLALLLGSGEVSERELRHAFLSLPYFEFIRADGRLLPP